MEERDQPFSKHYFRDHTILQNTIFTDPKPIYENNDESLFGAGTYVVQIPKNQVFRIPPPENGGHVRQKTLERDGKHRGRCCFGCSTCMCVCILVVMIILVIGIVGAVIFLSQDDPRFEIEHVTFKKPPPAFNFRVQIVNPNKCKEISYDPHDSKVSLTFKEKEIAKGKFPIWDQDPKNTATVGIILRGSNLPREIAESTTGKTSKRRIPFTLSMNVGIKFKFAGQVINSKRIDVSCSLLVDRLDKNTKLLSQDCSTN